MKILRTPDSCFQNLPGYPWSPNYMDDLSGYEGIRIHYLDEGPSDAEVTWLCLHGQPTWSYLFRKMIPEFINAGHRVIAPDMIGFGRSDKPVDDAVYTFGFHRQMLLRFVEALQLEQVYLVCQDWGGILGLTLPMEAPQRYDGLLVMNTGLGTGDGPLGEGFLSWREYVRNRPDFDIASLMQRGTPVLSEAEAAAYAAPYPDRQYRAGVRRFPDLVPDSPNAEGAAISRKARDWWGNAWQGKTMMAIGMQDPVLGPPVMRNLAKLIRNCPSPMEIPEAGHFVQEWGQPIARAAVLVLTEK